MTPECRRADERLLDFAYQELPEAERAEVAAHIDACERCSAELRAIAGTRSMLRALPDEEPSSAVTARLLHEAATPHGVMARLRALASLFALHPAWSLGTAAAVVLIGVVLMRNPETTQPDEREEAAREAVEPAHEPVTVTLPAAPAANLAKDEAAPAPAAPPAAAAPPRAAPPAKGALSRSDAPARSPKSKPAQVRSLDLGRAKGAPFAELEAVSREGPAEMKMGQGSAGGAGAARSAPAAAAPEPPTIGDSLDDVLSKGAGSAEKLQRRADRARARGDCTEALDLYRKILKEYPSYSGKAEVERGIRACQAAKAGSGTQNK